ncbi:MAG: Gx transporter family protein [Lachnospiraceae bacterium]|nr:Gx transporter family protein [Lachnospiraceae bacterium]
MNPDHTRSRTRRLVYDALLAGIALVIFWVELQIPPLTPIPGIKLGLANVLSLIALFAIGPVDALAVLLVRILLGGLVFGNPSALLYSLAGGALSYLVSLMLYKLLRPGQIFICGILCAVAHNVGQIAVAVLITRTPAILLYFPLLGVSGVVTGLYTGLAAGFAIKTLEKTN